MTISGIRQSAVRFLENVKFRWKETLPKIAVVAKKALLALAGAVLFVTNPTIFCIGFIGGIIWDQKAQELIDKVAAILKSKLLLSGLTLAVGAILSLPVTWAVVSLLYSSHLGSYMAQEAKIKNITPPKFTLF